MARASSALALLGALALTRCEGAYTLAPTACDDWCWATQRASCEEDYPEGCVSECEERSIGRRIPACQEPWRTLTDCYLAAPDSDFQCIEGESRPKPICIAQRAALLGCASPLRGLCLEVCLRQALECNQAERRCEAQCRPRPPGCEQQELALYECQRREPADCTDPELDARAPSEIPCLAEIGALLECAGFTPATP